MKNYDIAGEIIKIRKKKRELAKILHKNPENSDAITQLEKLEDKESEIWNS